MTADDVPDPCKWCDGTGHVSAALCYVPGPDPFEGLMHTAMRTARCKHCRGTGAYQSALDPTLDWTRGTE